MDGFVSKDNMSILGQDLCYMIILCRGRGLQQMRIEQGSQLRGIQAVHLTIFRHVSYRWNKSMHSFIRIKNHSRMKLPDTSRDQLLHAAGSSKSVHALEAFSNGLEGNYSYFKYAVVRHKNLYDVTIAVHLEQWDLHHEDGMLN